MNTAGRPLLYAFPCGVSGREVFLAECVQNAYEQHEVLFITPRSFGRRQFTQMDFAGLGQEILRLSQTSFKFLPDTARRALVRGLLKEWSDAGDLTFFAGFQDSAGIAEAVSAFFSELAAEGVSPEDFGKGLAALSDKRDLRAKDREVLALYLAYNSLLRAGGLYDRERVLLEAGEILRAAPPPWRQVYIDGFYAFGALEIALIRRLARHLPVSVGLPREKGREEIYQAAARAWADLLGAGFEPVYITEGQGRQPALRDLSRRLFAAGGQPAMVGEALRIKYYANRRQEMQEVAADIKSLARRGVAPADIVLAVRNLALYPGLRREFSLAGLPVNLPETARLSIQPPAKLIDSLLRAAEGEARRALQNMLAADFFFRGRVRLRKVLEENYRGSFAELRDLLSAAAGGEERARLEKLLNAVEGLPRRLTVDGYTGYLSDCVREFFPMEALGEAHREKTVSLSGLSRLSGSRDCLLETMRRLAADHRLAGEAERPLSIGQYRRLLQRYLETGVFLLQGGNQAGVRIVDNYAGLGENCRYVYIIGLKEREFPAAEAENWLYDDAERRRLAAVGFLAQSGGQADADRLFFSGALALAREGVWLSVSLNDRELASGYLDEVRRVAGGFQEDSRPIGQVLPGAQYLAHHENLAAWLLEQGESPRAPSWLKDYLGEDFPARLSGEVPERRARYAGKVPEIKDRLNGFFSLTFSPSRLENYAACPFKFLLEEVWRPSEWAWAAETMRPDVRGELYHECLKIFLADYLSRPLPADGRPEENLLRIFHSLRDKYKKNGRLADSWLLEEESAGMKKSLSAWLTAERHYQSSSPAPFYPVCLEWRWDKELTVGAPAGTVRITGQIDRIDSDGTNFFITDYKSKKMPGKKQTLSGADLQIPCYLLAADGVWGAPLGGGYFSVEEAVRDGGLWLKEAAGKLPFAGRGAPEDWPHYRDLFYQILSALAADITEGKFPPLPAGDCPSWCKGRTVCRAAGKTLNPAPGEPGSQNCDRYVSGGCND